MTSWPQVQVDESPNGAAIRSRRRDAQNGEISMRIVTDEVRHEIPAVRQRHADA